MFHYPRNFGSFIVVSLVMVMGLATACDGLIQIKDETTTVSPASGSTNAGASSPETPAPAASNPTATPSVFSVLPKVPNDAVALWVLITPLDAGFVDIAGERTLSNGQATEINRNDQINVIARANDQARWRFDRWGGDLQGPHASETLVMESPKKVRAMFVKVSEQSSDHLSFYGIKINGQPVRNIALGLDNGAVYVSPPPGAGDSPFREGTVVTLLAIPADGYDILNWKGDCGGSGSCVLIMNSEKDVQVTFRPGSGVTVPQASPSPAVESAARHDSTPATQTPSPVPTQAPIITLTPTPRPTPILTPTPVPTSTLAPTPTPRRPSRPDDIPGVFVPLGTTVSSSVSKNAKLRNVHALELSAGEEVQLAFNRNSGRDVYITLAAPGSSSFVVGNISQEFKETVHGYGGDLNWRRNYSPPVTGTYYLEVRAKGEAVPYHLTVSLR